MLNARRLRGWSLACSLATGAFLSLPVLAEEGGQLQALQECMAKNLPVHSVRQKLVLSSQDPAGGKQVLVANLYGQKAASGSLDLMFSLKEPVDLKGARYLLRAKPERDDMYVYLPALQKVRRVVGGLRGEPLWGTDFSYEDIKHLQHVVLSADTQYLGIAEAEGRQRHQLRMLPAPELESRYTQIDMDVDAQTCLLSEVRFSDEAGMFKRMQSDMSAFVKKQDRWVSGRVTMENLRNGTRSTMTLNDIVYDIDLAGSLFNPRTFYRAD